MVGRGGERNEGRKEERGKHPVPPCPPFLQCFHANCAASSRICWYDIAARQVFFVFVHYVDTRFSNSHPFHFLSSPCPPPPRSPAALTVGMVCRDGSTNCSNGTCCKMTDGTYGCCGLPNANCCSDNLWYVCPCGGFISRRVRGGGKKRDALSFRAELQLPSKHLLRRLAQHVRVAERRAYPCLASRRA